MARPTKSGLDYFYMVVAFDDKVKFLESEHGLEGFGILVKLWCRIYGGEGYYCDWNEKTQKVFAREQGVTPDLVRNVINTCLEENIFHREKFNRFQILTSSGCQKHWISVSKYHKKKVCSIHPDYDLTAFPAENPGIPAGNPDFPGEFVGKGKESIVYSSIEPTTNTVVTDTTEYVKGVQGDEKNDGQIPETPTPEEKPIPDNPLKTNVLEVRNGDLNGHPANSGGKPANSGGNSSGSAKKPNETRTGNDWVLKFFGPAKNIYRAFFLKHKKIELRDQDFDNLENEGLRKIIARLAEKDTPLEDFIVRFDEFLAASLVFSPWLSDNFCLTSMAKKLTQVLSKMSTAPVVKADEIKNIDADLYANVRDIWKEFYVAKTGIPTPMIHEEQEKAICKLIVHITELCKANPTGQPINDQVTDGFKLIFQHWDRLDKHLSKMIDIRDLFKNFNAIISQIKNHNGTKQQSTNGSKPDFNAEAIRQQASAFFSQQK